MPDWAIGASLNQNGRPVAFYSRTLNTNEMKHSSIEKEAYAIVEAIRKWRHFLAGRHFTLITDQRSVTFMFSNTHSSKIKNDKIQRWRLELSCYSFDIIYRAGKENVCADTLSRMVCSSAGSTDTNLLKKLHEDLCHPGITRMMHFVRCRNLPYSLEDVKRLTQSCQVCATCKPRFIKPSGAKLIKSTQPFERLSLDFKGPLPSRTHNKYILTVIDEYSRFPFAFACADTSTSTIIKCLLQLFAVFGMPASIHSDNGTGFVSAELKDFLVGRGIAQSHSTPYNPRGNGQCEKYNGTIWKAVTLALSTKNLPVNCWELVLPDALHSIRSLLCVATNCTPHERLFAFQRKSTSGTSLPSWLTAPGRALLRKHNRTSKYDPLVDEVEILEANPHYANVRLPNGNEAKVSLRDLAPTALFSDDIVESSDFEGFESPAQPTDAGPHTESIKDNTSQNTPVPLSVDNTLDEKVNQQIPLPVMAPEKFTPEVRRSERQRRAPDRLVL